MATSRQTDTTETCCSDDDSLLFRYDWSDETELGPSITSAVARLTEEPPERIGSELRRRVDLDGLDRLFRPLADGSTREGGELVVSMDACTVTIGSQGWVSVERTSEDAGSDE